MSKEATVQQKIEAQKRLCADKKYPHFAPYNGRCFKCNRQIYEAITLESASANLVTGCPFCNRSYCD